MLDCKGEARADLQASVDLDLVERVVPRAELGGDAVELGGRRRGDTRAKFNGREISQGGILHHGRANTLHRWSVHRFSRS